MDKQIPYALRFEFDAFMDAHNFGDLPDGAWFQCLEDAAQEFIDNHKLRGLDANDIAHEYVRSVE